LIVLIKQKADPIIRTIKPIEHIEIKREQTIWQILNLIENKLIKTSRHLAMPGGE